MGRRKEEETGEWVKEWGVTGRELEAGERRNTHLGVVFSSPLSFP